MESWFAARRALAAIALGAAGAFAGGFAAGTAQAADPFVACVGSAPEGFDIVQHETSATANIAGQTVFDTLVAYRPGSPQLQPALAERWEISPDGLTVTFHLRRGVAFHTTPWFKPTRELQATDVVESFRRILDRSHPAHASARRGYVLWSGMGMEALTRGVQAVDAHTVRFTLARPDVTFVSNLAMVSIGAVYPADYLQQLQASGRWELLLTQPVGSGPFQLRAPYTGPPVRLYPHTRYWGGAPRVDALVFAVTPDVDVAAQRLKAGECHFSSIRRTAIEEFAGRADLQTVVYAPLSSVFLALNTQRKPLDDVRVRQAVRLAVDRATMLQASFAGRGRPLQTLLPAAMWSHDATLHAARDPARARELVKAAGAEGAEIRLFALSVPILRKAIEALQADLQGIGLKVTLELMELGELFKRTAGGEHHAILMSWNSDNGDPDNFLTPNLSCAAVADGSNRARWCHAPFDDALDRARRTGDVAQRTALYQRAQRLVFDEVPLVPLYTLDAVNVLSRRVHGFVPSTLDVLDFRRVELR